MERLSDQTCAQISESQTTQKNIGRCSERRFFQIAAKIKVFPATAIGNKMLMITEAEIVTL